MSKKRNPSAAPAREPARASAKPDAEPAAIPVREEPTESSQHFFKPEDWLAGLAATLFSGCVFFYYMAPEVTLQDSGELVTGAFTFGVPHPPGYPLWAFLGFLWSHFIVPFGNPAWRIGLFSVVTGALTVGVMTITMTRSIRLLLHALPWSDALEERLQRWIALTVGVSTALLFGFNRGVWLWACVSEMRVLNQFSFVLTSCLFFAWTIQPRRRWLLYTTLLLFGLSLANHQTISVMAAPFAIGALAVGLEQFAAVRRKTAARTEWMPALMTSLASFWEVAAGGLASGMVGLLVFAWLRSPSIGEMNHDPSFPLAMIAGAMAVAIGITGRISGGWRVRRAMACAGLLLLGISFYLYMPLAASTNPPMNWGYAATKEGFLHAVTRGQYEKLHMADFFSKEFFLKIKVFIQGMDNQYSWIVCLLGLIPLVLMAVSWLRLKPRGRAWLVFIWAAFLATSLGLLTIINPKLDRQEQEITIKFFAPAHGFYAMLIGYGITVLLSLLAWRGPRWSPQIVRMACVGLLALPLVTFQRNWSLCALRGHDFGYLFGYLMFNPGGGYPPMDRNAVLYGGTDPGRFVPTYMIFCESRVAPRDRFRDPNFDRSDVYIITQNALADSTYMSYIRDHYDYSRPKNDRPLQRLLHRDHTYPTNSIFIPSLQESNQAFKKYFDDVQAGRIAASADIQVDPNGRVSVSGVVGVMAINGILAQWIFERNKDKHAFYVEESYAISWMYPYLRPAGIIMKIENEPLPSPQENPNLWQDIVARDRAYWDRLCADFLARPDFRRNNDAKKSFSKLRSALGGVYAARGMIPEAEYAFTQSLKLCPESPEASFRLADLYVRLGRYAEARGLIEAYQKLDIYNDNARGFLENVRNLERDNERRKLLEKQIGQAQGRLEINTALELADLYQRMNMDPQFQSLAHSVLESTNLSPDVYLAVAQMCGRGREWELLVAALRRYLSFDPRNFKVWIDLAAAELSQDKPDDALTALKRAVDVGGEAARGQLRQDQRFGPLQARPEFHRLVPPPSFNALPFLSPLSQGAL